MYGNLLSSAILHLDLNLRLLRIRYRCSGLCKVLAESFLESFEVSSQFRIQTSRDVVYLYLELFGKLSNLAPVLVVEVGVLPQEASFLGKCVPGFVFRHARPLSTSVSALYELLEFLERERLPNHLIVVFEGPRWEVEERLKMKKSLVPSDLCQLS